VFVQTASVLLLVQQQINVLISSLVVHVSPLISLVNGVTLRLFAIPLEHVYKDKLLLRHLALLLLLSCVLHILAVVRVMVVVVNTVLMVLVCN